MKNSLSQIVKRAFEVSGEDFLEIVDATTELLHRENGLVGRFEVKGRFVTVRPEGSAVLIGDLHGDLESLVEILNLANVLRRMRDDDAFCLIFLGDYGDRGLHSAEVYYVVLTLKLLFPKQTILLRGNHEVSEPQLVAVPHDLPSQLRSRFGNGEEVYEGLKRLFPVLYNAVLVSNRYLIVHAGLSASMVTVHDLACAKIGDSSQGLLEDMLWSDPDDTIKGMEPSPRGAGKLFGEDITREVLRRFEARLAIRGHESSDDGFKMNHRGKVLTLFSRKGAPYFNTFGAYLDIELAKNVSSAEQLIPFIHRF